MKNLIDGTTILLPLLYTFTVWIYARAFFTNAASLEPVKRGFLLITLCIHLAYLLLRTVVFGHPPITTVFEIMSVISFSVSVAYLYLEMRTRVRGTGTFIIVLALFFQVVSSIFIKDLYEVKPVLRSTLLGFHVSTALLGLTAFAISAVYGSLYLMLYHDIKANRFGVIYKRLPSLEILTTLSFKSTIFGFILLTTAITIGFIWLPRAFQSFSYTDPKLIGTFLIWALYGIGLLAKKIGGLHGRRLMILAITGFVIAFFSMTIINMFFSSFHNFY
ncbi:MAG: cytochrome c biogenesis protein CcsA [Bacteroidota bacterium]